MNGLFDAAKEVGEFMAAQHWEYCIIGGLAVQYWGEPRTTLDADMTLLTGWEGEQSYISAILGHFQSRIPNGEAFALARRILLIRASNGKDVDIALGALPFETEMVRRAVSAEFAPGVILPCCTAEDLFIMKAFASRPRDWSDAESIVKRGKAILDTNYILKHLADLCEFKDAPEILERAKGILMEKK